MMIKKFPTIIAMISIISLLISVPIKGQHYQVKQLEKELLSSQHEPDSIRFQILYKLCQKSISLAIEKFSQKNDFVGMAYCHQYLAQYAHQKLQKDSVCYHATLMQQLLETHAPEKNYLANFTMGNCASIQHEKIKAFKYYKKSRDQSLLAGDSLILAENLISMTYYFIEQNELDSASLYTYEAVKIMEKIKANYSLPAAYLMLGEIYYLNQDTINTFAQVKKAIKQARLVDAPILEAQAYYCLGYYELQEKKYESSQKHFETCHNISEKHDLLLNEIISLYGLGNVAKANNKAEEAINYYLTAINLSDEKGIKYITPILFLSISELIANIKSQKEIPIEKIISDIIALSEKEQVLSDRYNINLALKNLYENKKDFKKSLEFASKALALKDSLQQKKLTVSINELELKYENTLKEEKLEKQALILNRHKIQQRIYAVSTVLLLSLLGIGALFFNTRNKLYKQLKTKNEQLENQQKEISDLLEDVNNKNTLLEERVVLQSTELMDYIMSREKMEYQVKSIQSLIKKQKKEANLTPDLLADISSKVNNIFDQSNNWLRFKEKINSVYPNFFNNLHSAHPELSKKELKHCAYVLVRKKMNLDASTLLKDYLFSFSNKKNK